MYMDTDEKQNQGHSIKCNFISKWHNFVKFITFMYRKLITIERLYIGT